MTTRATLNKLPENIKKRIEDYRLNAKTDHHHRELYIALSKGYIEGLYDAGIITEADKRVLLVYRTITF